MAQMVICFECSRQTKGEIDRLIESGRYNGISEVIAVAVANLSVLHARVGDSGAVVLEGGGADTGGASKGTATPPKAAPSSRASTDSVPGWKSTLQAPVHRLEHFAPLPGSAQAVGEVVPLDQWVFGQYNRLLPVKFNCRLLANLLQQEPQGLPLTKAATVIAQQAAIFGDYLFELDRRYGIDRDQALATAFPRTGNDGDKGRLRYASQFVGTASKAGQLAGLLIDLKFINTVPGKEPRLLLTEPGWQFAVLPNPILEGEAGALGKQPPAKLTEEERRFLLDHIAQSVPVERFAYSAIVRAIDGGAVTPTDLDAALRCYVANGHTGTNSFFASQRSGVISRMSDLGLIARVRDGVKVRYQATPEASRFRASS